MSSWYETARDRIAVVHAGLPSNATLEERKAALKDAYPFGERARWPYKAWCKAQREYLARHEQVTSTNKHLSPMERMMARAT